MYLFDTNIFLETLLEQQRADICERALASATKEHPGWVTGYTLHSIEAIIGAARRRQMSARYWPDLLEKFLTSIEINPFMHRYETSTPEEKIVVGIANSINLDFDDALQYYVAKSKRLALVTLDKDFRGLKDIQVLDPAEV